MFIATGSLISEIVDVFSNVKETRIKVLSSYPSGHVEVRCPVDKKNKHISGQKNCFDAVESCCECDLINK